MANSKVQYTADGSTQSFAVTFPFISRDHVNVEVDDATATFTWDSDSQITISSPTLSGSETVVIFRTSSQASRLVDYVDGSNLSESDLDTDSKQAFYMAQEALDNTGLLDEDVVGTTSGDILVADGTNFNNVTMSGDVTIDSTGATTISSGAVDLAMMSSDSVNSAKIVDDSIVNADINSSAAIDATKIADGSVTNAEFQYLGSVTSDIQAQIDGVTAGTVTTIDDDNFTLQDNGDSTKKLQFQCSGITASTTRTLTAPDADDTIVGKATTDTLTNKTLTAPTINGVVGGTATSQTITTLTTDTVVGANDLELRAASGSELTFQDDADSTKETILDQSGATTAKKLTLVSSHTDNRSVTFPDATVTLASLTGTETLTNKTLGATTLSGEISGADQTVTRVNLKDYGEITNAIGSTGGGTQDIDLTLGNSVSATVDTSANTFTFSNPTASDELCGFTLMLTNGGSQTVNWPASVNWAGASAPTLTTSGVDCLVFWTIDGGTIWNGAVVGLDMS